MRNKFKLSGIIAVAAAIVLSMSACVSVGGGSTTGSADDGVPKTLVVTGIEEFSGDVLVNISSDGRNLTGTMVAVGGAALSGNDLTIPLVRPRQEDRRWTGRGEYFIVLVFSQDGNNVIYFYSSGGMSALRYNIAEATTTIPFNQFRRL